MDSHAYTAAGSYTAAVTVTDAKGDQAVSSAAVTISSDSSDPLFTPVVNSSSFSYIGLVRGAYLCRRTGHASSAAA